MIRELLACEEDLTMPLSKQVAAAVRKDDVIVGHLQGNE